MDHLPLIERTIRFVARRHRMRAAEAEEFAAEVRLRLIASNCEVLRKFEGRSGLGTFLTVVIGRLFLDFRNQQWGKWRSSAQAERLGPLAVRLERLIVRDGLGFAEACRHLEDSGGATLAELNEIARRLPARTRRTYVGEEALARSISLSRADDALWSRERTRTARRVAGALSCAVQQLDTKDQQVLRLRFREGRSIAEIARMLALDAKPLYRRFELLLRHLRRALRSAGIAEADVRDVLAQGVDLDLPWSPVRPTAAAGAGPRVDEPGVPLLPPRPNEPPDGTAIGPPL